jgi:predicted PurR-regulated permease PerM
MIKKFKYEKYYPRLALFVMVVLGIFLIYSLLMFLNPILGALIMYILTRPMQVWFTETKKCNNTLATVITMTISFVILIVPIVGISYMLIGRITELFGNTDQLFAIFDKLHHYVNGKVKFEVLSPETVVSIKANIALMASTMLNQTFTVVTDIGMLYFILYFMLASRKDMEATIHFYLPYKPENIRVFKNELKAQTYSNAIVTPLLALIQGITASLGYWLLGVDEPLFWGLMTGFFSFMPLVGCMIVWVPLSIFILAEGETWNGIGIIIYSVLITSNIDNVCRLILQKKFADVHPLITLLGFLMGIKYFGISGIIIGPVLMSFFLIMIKNFRKEFMEVPEDIPSSKSPS